MKAPRSAATPSEVTPIPPCGCTITRHNKIPKMEIAPSKLLKIKWIREHPNKLLKIKDKNKKDVKNEGTSQ
jgi:hypothetical protein